VSLVEVRGLKVHFPIRAGVIFERTVGAVRAVDGVDLDIDRGTTLGLVGESGCGKSTVGRALLRLEPATAGSVFFDGEDVFAKTGEELRRLRRRMQMVFQDPLSSLDPRQSIGSILAEPLRTHDVVAGPALDARVRELLDVVGLPTNAVSRFPHEFSGGQRQRVGIARAIALSPDLIIADEPVSALDVSIQAQVVNLLEELQQRLNLTYLVIAHDLAVVRHISARSTPAARSGSRPAATTRCRPCASCGRAIKCSATGPRRSRPGRSRPLTPAPCRQPRPEAESMVRPGGLPGDSPPTVGETVMSPSAGGEPNRGRLS